MTLETLQAVKFGGSKGEPQGRAQRTAAAAGATGRKRGATGRKRGASRSLEDGSGKGGEPKASREERAGNIDPTAVTVNHSKA